MRSSKKVKLRKAILYGSVGALGAASVIAPAIYLSRTFVKVKVKVDYNKQVDVFDLSVRSGTKFDDIKSKILQNSNLSHGVQEQSTANHVKLRTKPDQAKLLNRNGTYNKINFYKNNDLIIKKNQTIVIPLDTEYKKSNVHFNICFTDEIVNNLVNKKDKNDPTSISLISSFIEKIKFNSSFQFKHPDKITNHEIMKKNSLDYRWVTKDDKEVIELYSTEPIFIESTYPLFLDFGPEFMNKEGSEQSKIIDEYIQSVINFNTHFQKQLNTIKVMHKNQDISYCLSTVDINESFAFSNKIYFNCTYERMISLKSTKYEKENELVEGAVEQIKNTTWEGEIEEIKSSTIEDFKNILLFNNDFIGEEKFPKNTTADNLSFKYKKIYFDSKDKKIKTEDFVDLRQGDSIEVKDKNIISIIFNPLINADNYIIDYDGEKYKLNVEKNSGVEGIKKALKEKENYELIFGRNYESGANLLGLKKFEVKYENKDSKTNEKLIYSRFYNSNQPDEKFINDLAKALYDSNSFITISTINLEKYDGIQINFSLSDEDITFDELEGAALKNKVDEWSETFYKNNYKSPISYLINDFDEAVRSLVKNYYKNKIKTKDDLQERIKEDNNYKKFIDSAFELYLLNYDKIREWQKGDSSLKIETIKDADGNDIIKSIFIDLKVMLKHKIKLNYKTYDSDKNESTLILTKPLVEKWTNKKFDDFIKEFFNDNFKGLAGELENDFCSNNRVYKYKLMYKKPGDSVFTLFSDDLFNIEDVEKEKFEKDVIKEIKNGFEFRIEQYK